MNVVVYDMTGKMVFNQNNINSNNEFDFTNFKTGVYMMKVGNETSNKMIKFMIKK